MSPPHKISARSPKNSISGKNVWKVRSGSTDVDWQTEIISRVGRAPATFRWVAYGGFYGDETLQADILTGEYWSSTGEFTVVP